MSKLNVQVREDEEDKEGGEEEGEVMTRGEGKQNSVNHENKNIKKVDPRIMLPSRAQRFCKTYLHPALFQNIFITQNST